MTPRRTLAVLLAAVCVAGLTACGKDGPQSNADSEGTYVTLDHLRYQVQISRQLNPTDIEDRDYLVGIPKAQASLAPDELWFGIFIRVQNKTSTPEPTASSFTIEDTQNNAFEPTPTNNLISYKPTTLTKDETFPRGVETAAYGPTQGKLLLFKIHNDQLANRPLELTITAPDGTSGKIRIDV